MRATDRIGIAVGGSVRIGVGAGCGSLGTIKRNGIEPDPGKHAHRASSVEHELRQRNATDHARRRSRLHGSTPVGGDAPVPAKPADASTPKPAAEQHGIDVTAADAPARRSDKKKKDKENESAKEDDPQPGTDAGGRHCAVKVDPDKVVDPGSEMTR